MHVHGQLVPLHSCTPLNSFPSVLDPATANRLVSLIDTLHVCPGNPEIHFTTLCNSRNGHIEAADGRVKAFLDTYYPVRMNGQHYSSTMRTTSCALLVTGTKCTSCKLYRVVLRALRSKTMRCPHATHITSHVNYRYLTTLQLRETMSTLKAEVVQQKREIDKLKERVRGLTVQCGVVVDDALQHDLCTIMEEMTEHVREKYSENSFHRVFWEQQLNALSATNHRQLRWHPALIKWCLNLKLRSSSTYRALRESGILVLPSERTLRDYTHWVQAGYGFSLHSGWCIM